MPLFLIVFLFIFQAQAQVCPSPQVGFGLSSLNETRKQINSQLSTTDLCVKRKEIFSNFEKQSSDIESMGKSVKDSKLIILSEMHLSPVQRSYGEIFNQLKEQNGKIDCIFLEWNESNPDISKLLKGEKSESMAFDQHLEFVQAAKAAQAKVFAVDGRTKANLDPRNYQDDIKTSNVMIFNNIKKLFDSKTCTAGILLIGKAHVEHTRVRIDPKDSIKTLFVADGTSTTAINLVYTAKNIYANYTDEQWQWDICNEQLEPVKKQVAMSRARLNATPGMVLYPVQTQDYYLFLPEVEQSRLFP